jgi:flagellar biosynthesis/type III secretory pathway chaperone
MNASVEPLVARPAAPAASRAPASSRASQDAGPPLAALDELLTAQVEGARRLRATLAAEHFALERRDVTALTVAAAERAQAIADLDAVERRRRALCLRIGAGPGQPELAAWLDAFSAGDDRSQRLRGRVRELGELLRECRATHEATSMATSLLQRQVQQALDVLAQAGAATGASHPQAGPDVT